MSKSSTVFLVLVFLVVFVLAAAVYGILSGVQSTITSNPVSNPNPTLSPLQTSPSPFPSPAMFELPALNPPAISIYVPDNYSTIQQAVDSASPGSAIFVRAGEYHIPVTINKAVWLIGENGQARIDANSIELDLLVCHSDVNITGFDLINTPTPATGSWLEQMQGIGLPKQLPALQVKNSQNCNIYGNKISNSSTAVILEGSSEINVFSNEVYGCSFQITNSTHNKLIGNSFVAGGTGINLKSSADNILVNNTMEGQTIGIWLDSSSGNTFRANKLTNNYHSFGVTGNNLAAYVNDVDTSNTIEGKPIYYWVGRSNQVVPSDGACVVLVNCTDMTVQNSVLSLGFGGGLVLTNTNSSIVQGNTLATQDPALLAKYSTPGNPLDITLYHSHNNQVRNNCATVWLNCSNSNMVTQNTGVIRLTDSNYNQIVGNNIHRVAFLGIDWSGVTLRYSAYNIISGNSITDNSAGVWLCDGAKNNRVENNTIDSNGQGGVRLTVWPESSGSRPESNLIFNNTISHNGNQGLLDSGYNTTILGNQFIKNSNYGLDIRGAVNCNIIGNVIEGIVLGNFGHSTYNCTIVGNDINITSGLIEREIWFVNDAPAVLYHNNFLSSISFDRAGNVTYTWDNGAEGNYWSDYNGIDANGDGIGDTPYTVNQSSVDRYPLIKPYDITRAITKTLP